MFKGFFRKAFGIGFFRWLFEDGHWLIILAIILIALLLYVAVGMMCNPKASKNNVNKNSNTNKKKNPDRYSQISSRFLGLVNVLYNNDTMNHVKEEIVAHRKPLEYGCLSRKIENDYTSIKIDDNWNRMKDGSLITLSKLIPLNHELGKIYRGKAKHIPQLILEEENVYLEIRIYDDELCGDAIIRSKTCAELCYKHFKSQKCNN